MGMNAHYTGSFLALVRYALIASEVLYAVSVEFIAVSKLEVAFGLTRNVASDDPHARGMRAHQLWPPNNDGQEEPPELLMVRLKIQTSFSPARTFARGRA